MNGPKALLPQEIIHSWILEGCFLTHPYGWEAQIEVNHSNLTQSCVLGYTAAHSLVVSYHGSHLHHWKMKRGRCRRVGMDCTPTVQKHQWSRGNHTWCSSAWRWVSSCVSSSWLKNRKSTWAGVTQVQDPAPSSVGGLFFLPIPI